METCPRYQNPPRFFVSSLGWMFYKKYFETATLHKESNAFCSSNRLMLVSLVEPYKIIQIVFWLTF